MSNLTFIIGQVRALESKLINQNQIDRMVGAKTPLDAFRVFIELSYAEYINESTTPDNFEQILEQGLLETRNHLIKGTDNHKGLHVLWGQFDMNNIKKAAKDRFLDKKKKIEHFHSDYGYSSLGILSQSEIENIVWNNIFPEGFSDAWKEQLQGLNEVFEKTKNIQKVENKINRAYVLYFKEIGNTLRSSFIKKLVEKWIDKMNMTSIARSLYLRKKPLPKSELLIGGSFDISELEMVNTQEKTQEFILRSELGYTIKINEKTAEEKAIAFEVGLEESFNDFINEGQVGEINSIQVLFSYFNRRIRNAKRIKCIMFGKYNGLSDETIYEALKTF